MSQINPRVDIAFKKLFGVEENKDLLISLINSIVSDEDQVKDVVLLNPYNLQNFKTDKLSILDIKAEGHDGKRFNIEIQMTDAGDYNKRALYYWAELYAGQLAKGQGYSKLNKAIGIHILNFLSVPESKNYHNVFYATEKDTGIRYFDDFEIHTIELTKFSEGIDNDFHKLLSKMKKKLDIWSGFLTKYILLAEKQDQLPKEPDYSELKKALNIIEVMNFSEEERNFYEDHLKWLRDEESALEKKYKTGLAEGKAEGLSEGMEKGMYVVARNMLQEKADLKFISKVTGLSVEEIAKIQAEK